MKRLVVLLAIVCLALFLVGSCGKSEEPAKAQKPAASTVAPAKEAEKKQPEKQAPAAPQTPAPKPGETQTAPVKPNPDKK
jgi:hypothetical protein